MSLHIHRIIKRTLNRYKSDNGFYFSPWLIFVFFFSYSMPCFLFILLLVIYILVCVVVVFFMLIFLFPSFRWFQLFAFEHQNETQEKVSNSPLRINCKELSQKATHTHTLTQDMRERVSYHNSHDSMQSVDGAVECRICTFFSLPFTITNIYTAMGMFVSFLASNEY